MSTVTLLLDIVLEALANSISVKKEIKDTQLRKKNKTIPIHKYYTKVPRTK